MMKYIEAEHEKDLVGFKYRGGTSSITYQYLWSPLAEKLLLYIPVWVAPNLITLVAFIIVVVSHLLFFFVQEDQLGAAVPVWKLMLFGITMFVYQHLDNIDGKQARRTGTSSPVGMLFDHGADALTGVIFAMQIGRVLHLSSSYYTIYAICFQIMIPNFFALLLQYSVGEFKLDRINPIDYGIPAYTLLAFAGCFIDFSFWDTPHWFANYNEEFLLLFGVVIVFILYNSCKNVFKDSIRYKSDVAQKAWLPVILITFLLVMKVLGLVWIYHKHYFVVVYWLTFFWSRNMMLIQVCYVTKQVYQVWNWSTLFFCLASMGSLVVAVKSPQSMGSYLFAVCLVQCSFLCEFIFSFLKQSTTILKIKLLKIPYRYTKY